MHFVGSAIHEYMITTKYLSTNSSVHEHVHLCQTTKFSAHEVNFTVTQVQSQRCVDCMLTVCVDCMMTACCRWVRAVPAWRWSTTCWSPSSASPSTRCSSRVLSHLSNIPPVQDASPGYTHTCLTFPLCGKHWHNVVFLINHYDL